ncbi:probable glutamate receptor [Palaemon carinicauda]|uniref:probable glutamate receptor n=1 Tax=Palaemon carinicauda TaxID=392227 RepID=UPI0035B642FB
MMRDLLLRGHLVKWLLILEGEDAEASLVVLQELATEGTEIMIFLRHAELNRVYYSRVDDKGVTRFKSQEEWKGKIETKRNLLDYEKSGFSSVNGRQMIVGVKESLFSISLSKTYPDGRVEIEAGLDFSVLKALSSLFNFTYKAVLAPDDTWGNVQPDGSVTGIIGMIAKREVTFGVSVLVQTESRVKVVDFSAPYIFSRMALLTRSPKEKTKVFAVFTSFDVKVWICLTAIVLMISPVIYIISHLRSRYHTDEEDVKDDIQWYAFNMFRSIIVQGNYIHTKSGPTRLLLVIWFLCCLIFSASYSGMLTAVLAVPAYEKPIDSLEDLPRAVKEGYTLGVLEDSSSEYIFKSATDGIFKQTWNLFNHEDRKRSFVPIPVVGMKKVIDEKFVFITGETYGDIYAWKYGRANFHFGREKFLPVFPGVACQKGSPLVDNFTRAVLRFREGGLIEKWLDDYFTKTPKDELIIDKDGKRFSFTLVHLQAAFYLVLLGFGVASLALLAEVIMAFIFPDQENYQSFRNLNMYDHTSGTYKCASKYYTNKLCDLNTSPDHITCSGRVSSTMTAGPRRAEDFEPGPTSKWKIEVHLGFVELQNEEAAYSCRDSLQAKQIVREGLPQQT